MDDPKFVVYRRVKDPTQSTLVRINKEDKKKMEKIAKETGHTLQEIIRKAIHFAMESM